MTRLPIVGFPDGPILHGLGAFGEQPLTEETFVQLADARIVYADYDLIAHDFAGLAPTVPADVDAWLVEHAGYLSLPQAAQSTVNTPVPVAGRTRVAWRPPRYGRAAVMTIAESALIDVKGCGASADDPPRLPNSNGLLTLNEALFELVMERLAFAALRHAGDVARPTPIYAILDLGFDVRFADGRSDERATALLRRAQTRPRFQWGRTDPGPLMAHRLLEIERTLRRYGLSASNCGAVRFRICDAGGRLTVTRDGRALGFSDDDLRRIGAAVRLEGGELWIDGVNVQVTDGIAADPPLPRLLDFGRYRLASSFTMALYAAWEADYENLRGELVLPGDAAYVQPDPRLTMARPADDAWSALRTVTHAEDIGVAVSRLLARLASHLERA